jgi:hypothetical protein
MQVEEWKSERERRKKNHELRHALMPECRVRFRMISAVFSSTFARRSPFALLTTAWRGDFILKYWAQFCCMADWLKDMKISSFFDFAFP